MQENQKPTLTIKQHLERMEKARERTVKPRLGWRDYIEIFATPRKIGLAMIATGALTAGIGGKTFFDEWNKITEATTEHRAYTYNNTMNADLDARPSTNKLKRTLDYSSYAITGGLVMAVTGSFLLGYRPPQTSPRIVRH